MAGNTFVVQMSFGRGTVRRLVGRMAMVAALMPAAAAAAQAVPERASPGGAAAVVQSAEEALAQDAAQYALRHPVSPDEAVRRLRAQEASTPVSERIAAALHHRLAGISIEHAPQYRLVVLLAGSEPVADQAALAAGSPIPVVFQLGAAATRQQIVAAMRQHQPALRSALPRARGIGLDQRTGELVLFVTAADARLRGTTEIARQARALTGVPVRVEIAQAASNLVRGGARVAGFNAGDGKRYACTTGFVVHDGQRTGVVTAAHCPDVLQYAQADGASVPLGFIGQWGARHQDVQVNVAPVPGEPLFYADRRGGSLRPLTGARARHSTRAGDTVCHWGESSGYSCSEVELTDFAPPADLCAGGCEPVWVSVRGPSCKSGDSGGPVFRGTVAFGILKGGSGITGRCNFYYYMSTDFIPAGWSLLQQGQPLLPSSGRAED